MTLLERDVHVTSLLQAMRTAADGTGSVALVTGEAGIGKSTVVNAFVDALPVSVRLLQGACDDLLAPPSLGPLREAVAGTGGPLEQAIATNRLQDAINAVGLELGDQATTLIVEDVHWADDATLDLLRYLVRRIHRYPALIVLTFRDEHVDAQHRLRPLLSTLASVTTHRLALEPLTRAAVARLTAGTEWDPAELHHLTGGNPFYVTEALAGPKSVSASVVDTVLARLRALDAETVAVVEQLSVVPTEMDLTFVTALVDSGIGALAEAEARGILVVRNQQLGFRHEIARRAIAQSMTSIQRRALNQRVVQALMTLDDPPLHSLVHHAFEAGDAEIALRYAPQLARQATNSGAHRQALASIEAVLPHAGRLPPAERAVLYDDYAWELQIASRFTDAIQVGQQVVELRRLAGDASQLAEAQARQARFLSMAGDIGTAKRIVEQAVRTARRLGSPVLEATTTAYQAVILVQSGDITEALPLLRTVHDQAIAADRLRLICLAQLGVARCIRGDNDGLDDVRAAIAAAKRSSEPGTTALCQLILDDLLYRMHRWHELSETIDGTIELTNAQGYWSFVHSMEIHRAALDLRRGNWSGAETTLRQLIESVDHPGLLLAHAYPLLGRLLARRGHPDAGSMLEAAWTRALAGESLMPVVDAGTAYAEWAWLNGRTELVAEVRDTIARGFPAASGPLFDELRLYLHRGGAPLDPRACGDAALFEPIADGLSGDWKAAAAGWRRTGDRYEEALELASAGMEEPMVEAVRTLDDLGADHVATLVRRELKSLGVHSVRRSTQPRSVKVNPAGLSDRQLEVLMLLTEGLTNREIAERLVVSVRTVDHHVAAILAKLGAANRREAITTARSWHLHRIDDPTRAG
ncbi:ATP-binding protein [Kribbella sp. CA-253562]|uniref:ATP-binding protein n=1 Tax=Kribbella sp. CA-253562 TaxID=3239942 RepID=UPI003D8BC23C